MEELLLAIAQILFELFGEAMIQVLAEWLGRLLVRAFNLNLGESWLASRFIYAGVGGALGAFSLIWKPRHIIPLLSLRILYLLFAPILLGYFMRVRGKALVAKDRTAIKLDTFLNGYLFALGFALVRFVFAK